MPDFPLSNHNSHHNERSFSEHVVLLHTVYQKCLIWLFLDHLYSCLYAWKHWKTLNIYTKNPQQYTVLLCKNQINKILKILRIGQVDNIRQIQWFP